MNRIKALIFSLIYSAITFLIALYILGSVDDPFATDNQLYFFVAITFVLPLAVFVIAFNYYIAKLPKDKG
jgi:hypothetical protein